MPWKRRAFWKRRRIWLVLAAVVAAVALTLWLISNLGVYKPPD